jgi:hypothetical protein
LNIRLPFGDTASQNGQPAGRRVCLEDGAVSQAFAEQQIGGTSRKFVARAIDHPRGNLFDTDLE